MDEAADIGGCDHFWGGTGEGVHLSLQELRGDLRLQNRISACRSTAEMLVLCGGMIGGLLVGTLLGLINGVVVGYLRLNPIIWTLAAMALIDGTTRWAYGGKWIYAHKETVSGAAFSGIYRADVFGVVPLTVLLLGAAALVSHLVLQNTVYGRRLVVSFT